MHGDVVFRGFCLVCGTSTTFYGRDPALYREELFCGSCGATSRYRSIAHGLLRAIDDLMDVQSDSLAALPQMFKGPRFRIYDPQRPFFFDACAYTLPERLSRCRWIDVSLSVYRPEKPWGIKLETRTTNQNLESLTFPDATFDILITSDVMEYIRLDDDAHREIRRVLKPGGIYIFTVPHLRDRRENLSRVAVIDPADPSQDQYLADKEYRGEVNASDGRVLRYRSYGTELDKKLQHLGFNVTYTQRNQPELGIMNTELFYCRLIA